MSKVSLRSRGSATKPSNKSAANYHGSQDVVSKKILQMGINSLVSKDRLVRNGNVIVRLQTRLTETLKTSIDLLAQQWWSKKPSSRDYH
jgi:hypothetical protein